MRRQVAAIRVPLNVDAQFRVAVGPLMLPVRAIAIAAVVSPAAYLLLTVHLPGLWGPASAGFILAMAASFGLPEREGVWIGTHLAYRHAWRLLPSTIARGQARRARVREVAGSVHVSDERAAVCPRRWQPRGWRVAVSVPVPTDVGDGIVRLDPGGHRAVLVLEGPPVSISSDAYLDWCRSAVRWMEAIECPVQLVTLMTHHDAERVGDAFDSRVAGWPLTPLRAIERTLAARLAQTTLGLRHHVVLAPLSAGPDGVPHLATPWRAGRARAASAAEAEHVLQSALRLAPGFAIDVRAADRDDVAALLANTPLAAARALTGVNALHIAERHHVVLTATRLPASLDLGVVVDAMTRAHCFGIVSLHVVPVAASSAQRYLRRRSSMLRHATRTGVEPVEAQLALQDTADVAAALAQRDITPCRIALTISLGDPVRQRALDAAERLAAVLLAHGFQATGVDGPGFLPSLAAAPGCPPLARSLVLTSDSVVERLLPCLGTPFADITAPLVGLNVLNGTPAHFSAWSQPNHNVVVVGSSGSGKSVAAKTLLVRHVMERVGAVVIDPDSEYAPVMRAVGGRYLELGVEALNPLGVTAGVTPDTGAGMVLPILSLMSGDDRGMRDGRPIRRLPDEDQGWLHGELIDFLGARRGHGPPPLLRDLVTHLQDHSMVSALTARERERCRVITARLLRFTQGRRAAMFDRQSTFAVTDQPVAIGLRTFAMTYGADLTPALAVLLTAILDALRHGRRRMIVVVDEAHRVTSDPDAGEVLGQLVRQARKHGAGVWMVSQRIEDFMRTDLGRTLAATSSTKLVLGTEEAVVDEVAEVFKLRDEEVAAICPSVPGRGVLMAGAERAVVSVVPGPALMALADTRAGARRVGSIADVG